MNFSERLKNLRLENGYTQKELAQILGIAYQGIQKYEKGVTKPRLARLEELAILFDVSISYLLGETDVRTSSMLNNTADFSKRIKALRIEAGYTQKELAEKLGMTNSGYSSYGSEIRPTFPRTERLEKLAEVLNVSVSYLLGETDERPAVEKNKASTFSERLMQLRIHSGYSQSELANKLKFTSRQVYNNYEKGINKPSKENLEKLAEFFNVSVEYLLCETDEHNPSN
ncbi:helix-turn-helix transcriptional regulator [Lactococcus lactis]|uniref:helix-turn-helix domain-containing protein n=1 Tax=Lactococcus lactis TaxID=1358 RepID=UPI00191282C8|nr:helix-turn-helix transcriptional regulator [Lactococcus lactis]MBK5077663.1 helix-turn-helix transcriptional regulator [Lactococcus lactis]